jgi:hypothetical protein
MNMKRSSLRSACILRLLFVSIARMHRRQQLQQRLSASCWKDEEPNPQRQRLSSLQCLDDDEHSIQQHTPLKLVKPHPYPTNQKLIAIYKISVFVNNFVFLTTNYGYSVTANLRSPHQIFLFSFFFFCAISQNLPFHCTRNFLIQNNFFR